MTIDERTQQILAERMGVQIVMLQIANARLQAELEARVAEAAERRGTVDGAQGADGPQKEGSTNHG